MSNGIRPLLATHLKAVFSLNSNMKKMFSGFPFSEIC